MEEVESLISTFKEQQRIQLVEPLFLRPHRWVIIFVTMRPIKVLSVTRKRHCFEMGS